MPSPGIQLIFKDYQQKFSESSSSSLGKRNVQGCRQYFLLYLCAFCCAPYQHWAFLPCVFPNSTSQCNGFKVSCVTRLFRLSLAFLVLLYLILYKQYVAKGSNWEKSMSYSGQKSLLSKPMELLAHWLKMGHVDFGAGEWSIAQSVWGEKMWEIKYFNLCWISFICYMHIIYFGDF